MIVQDLNIPKKEILVYPFSPMLLDSAIAVATVELGNTGIQVGDTITAVNQLQISKSSSCAMAAEIERALQAKEDIQLQVIHKGESKSLVYSVKTIVN